MSQVESIPQKTPCILLGVRYSNGKVTWLGGPFWTINRLFSVRFSDHNSNIGPFDNRTQIYHLYTRLVLLLRWKLYSFLLFFIRGLNRLWIPNRWTTRTWVGSDTRAPTCSSATQTSLQPLSQGDLHIFALGGIWIQNSKMAEISLFCNWFVYQMTSEYWTKFLYVIVMWPFNTGHNDLVFGIWFKNWTKTGPKNGH